MSANAFFVQTCREEHKRTQKFQPILQNFPRSALRGGRSGFFLFCSESRPKIKSTNPGISTGDVAKKLGKMWDNLRDGEKQPSNDKAAKLKKYEKDVADYKSKGKFDGVKGPAKVARKKV